MTSQFITLKDKRRLGFAEYGSATGMPFPLEEIEAKVALRTPTGTSSSSQAWTSYSLSWLGTSSVMPCAMSLIRACGGVNGRSAKLALPIVVIKWAHFITARQALHSLTGSSFPPDSKAVLSLLTFVF
jgi:hypothetical protein